MDSMHTVSVPTVWGEKTVSVYHCDITDFDEPIDILTASAFHRSYYPTRRSLFGALYDRGISVQALSVQPELDLRQRCNVWLSRPVTGARMQVGRIGCVEVDHSDPDWQQQLLRSILAYFQLLDIAATYDIPMDTVSLPLLCAGEQGIGTSLTVYPLINACVDFLKRNPRVRRICFIERNPANAFQLASALNSSYSLVREQRATARAPESDGQRLAFISYTSHDRHVADMMCEKLERSGIRAWYAPRNIDRNDYATAIVEAISRCTDFIVIISREAMGSEHVLNEIDLAFGELSRKIRFIPFRIDRGDMVPAFSYYLHRQHWLDANDPPLEQRLDELVDKLLLSSAATR